MYRINENYLKLPGSYLFSTIGKKVSAFSAANPDKRIIRLGIGDVTQPLPGAVVEALHRAVDEMADADTFHGYAPDLGYEFLRKAIAELDVQGQNLLSLRYSGELTMEEIGQIYGISRMAVSKRLKKLHEKLGSSVS